VAPQARTASGPVHLLVDSTEVKLSGPGEWLVEKQGTQRHRAWRKLHLGVDARTGMLVASTLTSKEADDAAELEPVLDQVEEPLAAIVADGAYDQDRIYDDVAKHSAEAAVVVPPRATAVLSASAETDPRDRHIQAIAEQGRMGWQKTSGYNVRAGAEGTMSRYKRILVTPCARTAGRRRRPASPSPFSTECSTSDARKPSAPPDNQGTSAVLRSSASVHQSNRITNSITYAFPSPKSCAREAGTPMICFAAGCRKVPAVALRGRKAASVSA
jgi:hypothetical protein